MITYMLSCGKRRTEHCIRLFFMLTGRENPRFWIISQNWRIVKARIAGSSSRRFALSENGTYLPEKYAKHLDGEIWELRPIDDRILFAGWVDGAFVLLHSFVKKSQKTPKREIEQAKRELADFKEREGKA